MIRKLFRWIFKPYEEDFVAKYVHGGVGFTGVEHDLWNNDTPRNKHSGVGYTGVYDE